MEWLVAEGQGAYYEIVHDLVVAYQGRGLMLTRRQSLLGRARALAERIHAPSSS